MKKLLLIEDDKITFELISGLLMQIGYMEDNIIWCSSLGEVAMQKKEDFEIVLTDLTLPDSEYFNTFDTVRNFFPDKPIIVLTGTAEINIAIKTIQHGAQDYLVKGEISKRMLHKSIQYAVERNRILENIFAEKQNLRATINNTKDIIWSIDRHCKIISANKAFWERVYLICGKKKSELQSKDFDKELYETWVNYYERALKGEVYKIVWSENRNDKTTYEEVSFNPIRDKDKKVTGISCFSRDITEQYVHLNMIEKQNDQLKKIAWVQSHEVRSPVASILGLVQLFNENDNSDPQNTEIIQLIKEAAEKLDLVTRKITDYTYSKSIG